MFKSIFRPKETVLISLQALAIVGAITAIFGNFSLAYWGFGILGYALIFGLGITVTFHRLLAHRSYRLIKPLEYLFSLFANLGCTGSSVGWVFVHRAHHMHTDTTGDPHSPVVYGRWGAIAGQYGGAFDKWVVRDIINDPVHRFFHDYHHLLLVIFPISLALLFGLPGLLFGWAVPVTLNTLVSRLSNWIDHEPKLGYKTFESTNAAHNVWWWSLVSFGEGWHNNHHAFPANYRFGIGYQYDPGKWVINALKTLRLATDSQQAADWRKS